MANYQTQLFNEIWGGDTTSFNTSGIDIYRRNLTMNAERSLSISYPTVVQLVGEAFFSQLSQHFIQNEMLTEGDWGLWGSTFPDWLDSTKHVSAYPFIPDSARLDWLSHIAERASDNNADYNFNIDPDTHLNDLIIKYCTGTTLLKSDYPIVDLWLAHQSNTPSERKNLIQQAKQKLALGQGQNALIWRPHWKSLIREVTESESIWLNLTLYGTSISDALNSVTQTFQLEDWLNQSTRDGLVTGLY